MTSIIGRMQKLVNVPEPVLRGKVTSVRGASIYVSSTVGLKEFQVASPSSYSIGDGVKFQGNNFLGRLPSESSTKVVVV